MQPPKLLTVIISFLNEGYEVERTVSSVLEFAENKVDILVINDGSNSLYDYEEMLRPYPNIKYVKNEVRRGVTVCRHWGVQQIETPYFILLDAHMRFYEKGWVDKIISYLQEDDRRILCCQTRALMKDESEEIVLYPNTWMLNGFNISYMNLYRRSYACKASVKNQCVISYDGAIYKCAGRDFTPKHKDGVLNTDGSITWDEQKIRRTLEYPNL